MTRDPRCEDAVVELAHNARIFARRLGWPTGNPHGDPTIAIYDNRVPRQAARLLIEAAVTQRLTSDDRAVLNAISAMIQMHPDNHEAAAEQWGIIEEIAKREREEAEYRAGEEV